MTSPMTTMALPDLIAGVQEVSSDVKSSFGALSPLQLNWKPGAEAWSVAQCLDHMIVINHPYLAIVDEVVAGRYPSTMLHRLPLLPGFFGRLVMKAVSPDTRRKLKARPAFQPSASAIDAGIVGQFLDVQNLVVEKMKSTRGLDLARIIITSPVASVVAYSLLDAFRIIVLHETRHLEQARRVTKTHGFPGS